MTAHRRVLALMADGCDTQNLYAANARLQSAKSIVQTPIFAGRDGWQQTERGYVQSTSRSMHFNPFVIRLPRAAAGPANTAALR